MEGATLLQNTEMWLEEQEQPTAAQDEMYAPSFSTFFEPVNFEMPSSLPWDGEGSNTWYLPPKFIEERGSVKNEYNLPEFEGRELEGLDNFRSTYTSDSEEVLKHTGRLPDSTDSARIHELYHNIVPQLDGLYHCPWEGQDVCQHRPVTLKGNYE